MLLSDSLLLLSGLISCLLMLASLLALSVSRSLLLGASHLDWDAIVLGLLLVGNGGAASEDVRVGLLELRKNLEAMLCLREASREHFDGLKHFVLEGGISYDRDSLLKHIVAKLMSDKALDDEAHADGAVTRLIAKLTLDDLVVPIVGALEDLVDLDSSLRGLKALFNNV